MHKLIIDNRNMCHHSGDPGRYLNDMAANLAVAGPGVVNVLFEGLVGIPRYRRNDRQVDYTQAEFFEEFH